jgi:tetratricopeptide (TPR) repeat protein
MLHDQTPIRPVLLLLLFLILLQTTIAARMLPHRHMDSRSMLDDALGSARAILAAQLYERADLYFHRGVPHTESRALQNNWFESTHRTIAPREHAHAEGDAIGDILPWLSMTIRTDPAGEDAYVVAAHWLSKSLGRHEEALLLLRSGLLEVDHPYMLLTSRGKVLLRQRRWAEAADALGSAIKQIHLLNPTPNAEALIDMREATLLHAFANEAAGNTAAAMVSLRNYIALTPERAAALQARLDMLAAGKTPTPPATAFFASHDDDDHDIACGRETHDHHDCNGCDLH